MDEWRHRFTSVTQQQGGRHIEHVQTVWMLDCLNGINIWCFAVYVARYWRSSKGCFFFAPAPVFSYNFNFMCAGYIVSWWQTSSAAVEEVSRRFYSSSRRYNRRSRIVSMCFGSTSILHGFGWTMGRAFALAGRNLCFKNSTEFTLGSRCLTTWTGLGLVDT